jgi:hypothetical protein
MFIKRNLGNGKCAYSDSLIFLIKKKVCIRKKLYVYHFFFWVIISLWEEMIHFPTSLLSLSINNLVQNSKSSDSSKQQTEIE